MGEDILQSNPDKIKFYQRKPGRKIWIMGVVAGLALAGILFTLFNSSKEIVGGSLLSPVSIVSAPQPTPFAFEELTIPYLRKKEYKSSLTELVQVAENQNYTGYLTSYNSDGLKINGYLTIPKGDFSAGSGQEEPAGGWPAIVFVHGYIPPASYQTFTSYSSYVDFLAKAGFVVFKIDLRGHADSEGEPGGSYYSSEYITDVLNARAALQSSDFVNAEKIGLWGHSMAGNVVMRALAVKPEIPAVVVWAGAVYSYEDWQKYGIDDGSYQPPPNNTQRQKKRQELFDKYGQFSPDSSFWKQVPATNYLTDIKGAIQLNHAVDDTVVNIGYSRDLAAALDSANVVHELKEYSSGGHNISGAAFTAAMQNTADFFTRYLK